MSQDRIPSIAAIVLGLDRLAKTRACIASLLRCEGWEPRIVLLDNGSRDGTGDAIEREFPLRRGSIADRIGFWTVGGPLRLGRAAVRELRRGNFSGIGGLLGIRAPRR
jgi:GT2 family glycosyltransferase